MAIRNKAVSLFALVLFIFLLTGCAAGQTPTAQPTATLAPVTPSPIPTATLAPTPTSVFVNGTEGQPWWNDTTFYEIFVRSFYDANGDGKGDFNGLTAKLDYLSSLGIKGIWLMPINPSPSYHGYDVADYYGINPDYGTMDDFKNFLKQAHQRGIRVIMDLVLNHTSSQNPWFVKSQDPTSKYRNWYIWSTQDPGKSDSTVAKYWHNIAGSGYYYGYFTADMPDLNYKNPEVTQEMENVVKTWLDLGIDGFRLDAAKYLIEDGDKIEDTQATHDWFKAFRPVYKAINPQALTVGEIWSSSYTVLSYSLGDQLDLGFDFDLAQSWVNSTISGDGASLRNSTVGEESIFKNGQAGPIPADG
jgi:alpha-amylase